MNRKPKYSFEQWCLDNDRNDLLERWDYDKNSLFPSEVAYKSEKDIWFKCPIKKHNSELHRIDNLANGRNKTIYCNKCRSFAQHVIDKYGKEYLDKIWNYKNNISPWEITYNSGKEVVLNCISNIEHVYKRHLSVFNSGSIECPICKEEQLIKNTSLGSLFPQSLDVWSEKNKFTPFDYSSCEHVSVWWKCQNGKHEDYFKGIESVKRNNFRCPYCNAKVEGSTSYNIVDLTGQVFGELIVVKFVPNANINDTNAYWSCNCSCGAIDIVVNAGLLRNGHVTTCGNKSIHYSGNKNPNWKGGITPDRMSPEYREWRNSVYTKDWYTCQCCGIKGETLNAHHIKDYASYKELRLNIDNGITLCINCHDSKQKGSLHNLYGTQGVTPEQLEEYINNRRKQLGILIPFNIDNYKKGNIMKPDTVQQYKDFNSGWKFAPYLALQAIYGKLK